MSRKVLLLGLGMALAFFCTLQPAADDHESDAVAAFATVEKVFQHPRCVNCHIEGDAPLQGDDGIPHDMNVVRGPDGHGGAGQHCTDCHGDANLPASYGAEAPPGAPHWGLPPADQKMAWLGLSASELCVMIKDPQRNGDRDMDALVKHVSEDALVLWGWEPGGERTPVDVPFDKFVSDFKTWAAADGPCPGS